jgi:hypothetical protein
MVVITPKKTCKLSSCFAFIWPLRGKKPNFRHTHMEWHGNIMNYAFVSWESCGMIIGCRKNGRCGEVDKTNYPERSEMSSVS